MRKNLPVTQREHDWDPSLMVVSATDLKGRITYANDTFIALSGFTWDELVGKAHNIVRHPDVPEAAFLDLWKTISAGEPWTSVVKNRRKNGDHYWVVANVIPLLENGRVTGYLSVRTKPERARIEAAERVFAEVNGGSTRWRIHKGRVLRTGPADWWRRVVEMPLVVRASVGFFGIAASAALPLAGVPAGVAAGLAFALAAFGLWRFRADVSTPLAQATADAYRLAGCDLRRIGDPKGEDEIARVRRALSQLNVNLLAVVGDVRRSAEHVSEVTAEIARGGQDLSARSEDQASSLEETAASMEQIAATTQQSADSASRADHLMSEAALVARAGSEAMDRVVGTMEGISGSSRRIAEIIGVIDGIAFQTNILALNAAVEAARAGEQGRGFAVVASEVRALATRSAEAAKEIRGLITGSVAGVESGAKQVDEAGRTIGRIVTSVEGVESLLSEITAAGAEQRSGIAQVNEAVTQLDTVVQRNAALAEESAAAAQSLADEASMVMRTLGIFKGTGNPADKKQ